MMGMSIAVYHALYLVYLDASGRGRLLVPARVDRQLGAAQKWAALFRWANRHDGDFLGTIIRQEVAQ